MDNITFESLSKYFKTLSTFGYISYNDVYKLLYLVFIQKYTHHFKEYITEEDYKDINKVLYCLYESSCLISLPNLCNRKC